MSTNWNPNDSELPNPEPYTGSIERNSGFTIAEPAVSGELEITIIRANGDVEEMGVVSYYHKNPFRQARWELDTFGEVEEETLERIKTDLNNKTPYLVAGVASLGLVGLAIAKKFT